MNMKKNLIALGAALVIGLTGCGANPQVNVEQAGMLATAAACTDKFAGVVVSENEVKIERDTDKQIEKLHVAVGDSVRANEKLFEYDTDTLSLTIEKQELEMTKLEQQLKDLQTQITNVEKQIKEEKRKKEKDQDKALLATLDLTLRSVKADQTQANYDKKALQAEISYNKDMLKNAVVRSPIKGTIRAIDENGSPYITIQQSGAYQVKGTLNELSMGAGIMEGVEVTILSRIDPTAFWTGTVSLVDYNSTSSNAYDDMYGNVGDGMSSSSSYPFYITLDSTSGLLLGQHVYIQIAAASHDDDLLRLPDSYIMDLTMDPETFATTGMVWGVDLATRTLVKMTVTLGEYDPIYGTYVIQEGIDAMTYLADPADPGVKEGASVVLRSEPEYMGQTEPAPSTLPGETGEGMEGETENGEDPVVIPIPPEGADGDAIEDPVNDGGSNGNYSGSLVIPTDDPEKV